MENTTKVQVISTIDELNQYLNGYVTKDSIKETLNTLINKL